MIANAFFAYNRGGHLNQRYCEINPFLKFHHCYRQGKL